MAGTLNRAWSRTWREIWAPLAKSPFAPTDLFNELVRGLILSPSPPPPRPQPPLAAYNDEGELIDPDAREMIANHQRLEENYRIQLQKYESAVAGDTARTFFRERINKPHSEQECIKKLEGAWDTLSTFDEPGLQSHYRNLVHDFLHRYSIRYELKDSFFIYPTLSGLFSELMSEVRKVAELDPHLMELLDAYDESLSDLRHGRSRPRMKACLQKQFNLIEALAQQCPGVTEDTLGAMCNQLDFPHAALKDVGKKLYGFGSNYPGIRHAGNPASMVRNIEMKDLLSVSLMLAALMPYAVNGIDADRCYSPE